VPRIAAGRGDEAGFISATWLRHSGHVAGGEPNLSLLAQHAMLDALPEHADLDLFVDNHLIIDGCDAPSASGLRVLLRRLAAKIWLENAIVLAGPRREAEVFRSALETLGVRPAARKES
jgi:hypothetical protein